MFYERLGSGLVSQLPPWLLLSTVGVVTREIASRQVQQGVVPALVSTDEAQAKSTFLAKKLRSNFDDRIQRVLAPGGYGNAERLVRRFVDAELDELESTIRNIDDVISHEITQAMIEVVEVETVGRVQSAISEAVQLNQSSAALDLEEILQRADIDGNDMITFDELYELISGAPIDPLLAPIARSWPVLKSERAATSRWDLWGSLLIAPQVKNAAKAGALLRRLYERGERQGAAAIARLAEGATTLELSVRDELGRAADNVAGNFGGMKPAEAAAAAAAPAQDGSPLAVSKRMAASEVLPRRRWWRPWSWRRRSRREH